MFNFKHEWIETNIGLLLVLLMLAISVGGLVEIAPLFFIKDTVEKVDGVRPYTPLELRGRDIYQREGCYLCHSQMIRPFRDEALRYGHYSLAAESQYDHPFQWGSKRTGPDLARVGKKYSNEWHVAHLVSPRSMVPESVMPNFPWLEKNELNISDISERMEALRKVGVPYSLTQSEYQANVKQFGAKTAEMLSIPDARKNLIAQAESGNYDGDRSKITEMDALVAYLQVLGTMVDFSKYDDDAFVKYR
ncbi:MAG TPA: cytochrome-c oxidase, cbb3-type subunit II [Sulfuriferula sp.]|nr:cytochrome-c oxidase, cbb3-type subunit II [Sulfuriferula sp.]